MKPTSAFLLATLVLSVGVFIRPVEAHSFWHQVKDQMYNRHGWQYGYGSYPSYYNYRGTGWGHSNPWGTYGTEHGWGHNEHGWGHDEHGWGHGGGHHDHHE